ncbi:unnamed protein product [Calicophoron daubneyi]|uniref:Innexin n=1 Tax=Calicophoron daubneyi TaxID=300641 RepID=A0AAV2T9F0_CALDB
MQLASKLAMLFNIALEADQAPEEHAESTASHQGNGRKSAFTMHFRNELAFGPIAILERLAGTSQALSFFLLDVGEHRRSGGHEHRHRGAHHYTEPHSQTFGDLASHAEGGAGGGEICAGESHGHSFGGQDHGAALGMDATFVWKLSKLGRIGSSRLRFDDDLADRLNYQYTGVLMFLFIGVISIRQYVGKPIQCWIPQEFTRGWEEYAENYCWVSNTYFAPIQNRLPPAPDREMLLIGYYQWAPIVMAIQALGFYLPCLIWRLFMSQSGFNVRRILQMACDSNVLLPEHTLKNVRFIARYMEGCIYRQRDYRRRKSGNDAGYSPTSYTGLGHQQHQMHQHHPGYLHPQHQSPPYGPSPNAPPLYTSAASHVNFTNLRQSPGMMRTPSEGGGRGNGGTPTFDNSQSSRAFSRGRRPTNSFLDRLRLRFSVSAEVNKNKKQFNAATDESSGGAVGGIGSRGSDAAAHQMLGHRKGGDDSQGFCATTPSRASFRPTPLVSTTESSSGRGWGCCGKRHGNYLVVLYFFTKLFYLANAVGQLFLMERFVGTNHTFYGLRVLIDLIRGREWFHSGNFPRVTFCDFEAKKLGKNHKYTLQCVLPMNMILEKIYIFLWFWHCFIGLVTLSSFIAWFYRMGFASRRIKFIRKYLKIMSVLRDTDKAASSKFVENYLRPDGVFLIRLISINVGDLMAGDLACELWHIYRHKRMHEAEDQKFLDATGGLGDFVMNTGGPGFIGSADTAAPGSGDIPLTGSVRCIEKNHSANAPLHTNSNNISSSNNNDDSIV